VISEAKLREIEERAENATPGPWACVYRGDGSGTVRRNADDIDDPALIDDARCPFMRGEVRYEDGVFAAASRTDIPALSKALREAAEIIELAMPKAHAQLNSPPWQVRAAKFNREWRGESEKQGEA